MLQVGKEGMETMMMTVNGKKRRFDGDIIEMKKRNKLSERKAWQIIGIKEPLMDCEIKEKKKEAKEM